MSFRSGIAVLLGFVGVAVLCGVTYFNDWVLRQTHFVGNLLPLSVFGILILFLLLLNPLLARLGARPGGSGMALSGRQLVVILAMVLGVAVIPGSGLMRTMTTIMMLPHHFEKMDVGWQRHQIVESAPKEMLADPGENETALNNFIQGMSRGGQGISWSDIPWDSWSSSLGFWVPLILMVYLGFLGLSLAVHRQWSEHEQLPYPLAKFAASLLSAKAGESKGEVLVSKLFWVGCGLVLVIHFNNYLVVWFPDLVRIPTVFDFTSIANAFGGEGAWGPYNFRIFFSVVAISYFLAADVGLSLGLSPMIYPFVRAFFTAQGVSLGGGGHQAPERLVIAGAFTGVFCGIIYTGRHYYLNTLRKVFGMPGSAEVGRDSVWGMRVFLLSMFGFVFWLTKVGLDWQIGALLALLFVIFYLVMARVVAETGLMFFQPWWLPAGVMVALLGSRALGPESTVIIFLVSVLFLIDPREAFMPFVANALKILEERRVSIPGGTAWIGAALAFGLFVAISATLYFQYSHGAMRDSWGADHVPKVSFAESVKVKQRLDAQGTLEESRELGGWGRLANVAPDRGSLISFLVGLVLVLLFTAGRLRFPNWPIHPVFFLVFCSYSGYMFAFSFLFGWFIKSMVTKYGGEKAYHSLKPVMFGLIAGDMLGGFLPIVVGFIYYYATGELPRAFNVLPT